MLELSKRHLCYIFVKQIYMYSIFYGTSSLPKTSDLKKILDVQQLGIFYYYFINKFFFNFLCSNYDIL